MSMVGRECEEAHCTRSEGAGWTFYSIERFYTAPLVYNISCSEQTVAFSTANIFKQNNAYSGTYEIADSSNGEVLASGAFDWSAHWRKTTVEVDLASSPTGRMRLLVTNQWGDSTREVFRCV